MNLEEVLNFRRSVRVFDKEKPVKPETVKHCLELATLAPNSSNMQLWEFYQITNPELLAEISKACLGQSATATASEIVVFVIRSVQSPFLNLKKEISCEIVRKNVRRNVSKTGNYIMGN